jgi:hypothetical protein
LVASRESGCRISFTGAKPEKFTAYPSKLTGGIYGRVDFVDLDGSVANKPNCINYGSAELQ